MKCLTLVLLCNQALWLLDFIPQLKMLLYRPIPHWIIILQTEPGQIVCRLQLQPIVYKVQTLLGFTKFCIKQADRNSCILRSRLISKVRSDLFEAWIMLLQSYTINFEQLTLSYLSIRLFNYFFIHVSLIFITGPTGFTHFFNFNHAYNRAMQFSKQNDLHKYRR